MKQYSDKAFNDLIFVLKKYVGDTQGLNIFIKMINENNEKFTEIKNYFIHDMNKFLRNFFTLYNDCKTCSKSLKHKIFNINFIKSNYIKDFDRFISYCYNNIDDFKNPYTNRTLCSDIINHLMYIINKLINNRNNII